MASSTYIIDPFPKLVMPISTLIGPEHSAAAATSLPTASSTAVTDSASSNSTPLLPAVSGHSTSGTATTSISGHSTSVSGNFAVPATSIAIPDSASSNLATVSGSIFDVVPAGLHPISTAGVPLAAVRRSSRHENKRASEEVNEDEDFMDVMLSILQDDAQPFPGRDADTVNKATCLFQPERFLTTHENFDVNGKNYEYMRLVVGGECALQVFQLTLASLLHGFDVETQLNEPVDMSEGIGLSFVKASPT
ncbi:hypothetical protein JRO89_XSUnG0043800 [Xanthoceras sorbifolium]|uniref:Uncharacterized protein n=1 Tax=Xanthoceras sorbifolium TaxID=99658 RepID=A0ABQ8GZZ7_9ROSI|nr:hypothetical protein JRO89_XSUnG0043800 [Xanthoceras sorbifolium]